MKYLGEEKKVQIKINSERKVEYIRCDKCGKKIMPTQYRSEKSSYVHIHTWHNDWGNDSVDSHNYRDFCKNCAKLFVTKYIANMNSTEELKCEHKNLFSNETYTGYKHYTDGYDLVENDWRKEKEDEEK